MKQTTIVLLVFTGSMGLAQNSFIPDEKYLRIASRAMNLYQEQKHEVASLTYDTLFKYSKNKGTTLDLIFAGMSYSKAGKSDKAFQYLRKGFEYYGKINVENLKTEPDLIPLQNDKRWLPLLDEITARNKRIEAKMNKPVAHLLDSIYEKDQGERMALDSITKKYGIQSPEVGSLWRKINKQDSANLLAVKKIINQYGWLGPDEVGQQGSLTIFLVIQHADSLTQVTYLPVMREAVKKGKAQSQNLALLEDRVLMSQSKNQIYGSQVQTDSLGRNSFHPIEDEANVNKRRASVGLGPIEDYAKYFGIDYKLPTSRDKKKD